MSPKRIASLTALFFLVLSPLAGFAQSSPEIKPSYYDAALRPGIRSGNARTLSYIDYMLPIAQSPNDLWFFNNKDILGNRGDAEQNVGLGYRKMIELFDEAFISGANVFYDHRYSRYNNDFHQIGLGGELLSQRVDLRLNGYISLSDAKAIGDPTHTFSFGPTSIIEHASQIYEEPLPGLDYEIGLLVPHLSDTWETRVFIGGYHYFSDLGKNVNGIRARLEVRPNDLLTIQLEVKDDNSIDTDYFIGGYLNLPFDIGELFHGRNPFGDIRQLWATHGTRSLEERMTEPVYRDIDIVASNNSVTTTSTAVSNLIYVDNSNDGDAAEDGSLNHPHNTLAEAFLNSRYGTSAWIYVKSGDGTATGYTGNFTLANNVTLWGSGYSPFNGISAGTKPLIDGGGAGNVVTLANNNEVMGATIRNGARGIYALNRTGGNIHNNTITGNTAAPGSNGIEIKADAGTASDFTITGNTLSSNGYYGFLASADNSATISDFTISGNTTQSNGYGGFNVNNSNSSTASGFVFSSNNSNLDSVGIGIVNSSSAALSDFTITGNSITDPVGYGLAISSNGGTSALSDFTISDNTITSSGSDGIWIRANNGTATISDITFYGNTITGSVMDGVHLIASNGGSLSSMNIGDTTVAGSGSNSIYGNDTGGGGADFDIHNDSGINNLKAENNYWGGGAGSFGGANTVDGAPFLTTDPNA